MTGGGARWEPAVEEPEAVTVDGSVEEAVAFPLSFSQQRLWFLDQLDPGNPAYLLPRVIELVGDLDASVLEACLAEIVRRHEVLRSRLAFLDGEPVQLVSDEVELRMARIDLAGLPVERAQAEALRLSRAEGRRPLRLERAPLLRITLLRLAPREHRLFLTLHHIVSDGWSTGVLIREVTALYRAFFRREPSPLPELPIQYGDFAHWQRDWLRGEALEEMLAYWRRQLGELTSLDLPQARPRPEDQEHQGAHIDRFLPPVDGLKRLARNEEATPFMALLAVFQAVLHRWTGRRDVVVGSPVANRNRPELEDLIGFFVNTLVLRTDFDHTPSFREILARVRRVTLGAYAHQDLPFEKLVESLRPERSLSRTPLFQVMFILQNAPRGVLELPGLSVSEIAAEPGVSPFDMTWIVTETEGGLAVSLKYDVALFDRTTMDRLLRHFQRLAMLVTEDPDLPLATLPLLDDAERHQVFLEWGDVQARPTLRRDLDRLLGSVANGAARLYLLGPALEPPPPEMVGEAALVPEDAAAVRGGAGETAARLIPDPFGCPGGRLLLSGQRARFSSDGRLEPEKPDAAEPPQVRGRQSRTAFVPPAGRTEEVLAGIWREVLKVDRVGVQDNFFELGGDSILSIQVVTKARREGIELAVKDIFRHQTISRLSEATGQAEPGAGADREAPAVASKPQPALSAGAQPKAAEFPLAGVDQQELAAALNELEIDDV